MQYKRKREYSPAAQALVLARPFKRTSGPAFKKRRFTPGKDRTSGYYGRYAGGDAEMKFKDVEVAAAQLSQGATIANSGTINVIAQGPGESERIGRKCTIKNVFYKYNVSIPEQHEVTTPSNGDTIRVILYLDKQCNGETAAATDILETADIHSYRNLANSGRFTILSDRIHVLNYATMASEAANQLAHSQLVREFSIYKKCNVPIEYNATTGAIAEIRSNNLGFLFICKEGNGGIDGTVRLRYSDK